MAVAPGTRLGPYEVLAPLGAGGMGEVYRATDTRLHRSVAIKILPAHHSASPEIRARFEREARVISSLNHPNICVLYDVGHEDGVDYLVMELLEGDTLAHRLARGPLPTAEVLRRGLEIADALDRAHRSGVVHRDLKPGNIMLTRSGTKLLDFGLARPTGLAPRERTGSSDALSQSPTAATPLTAEGTIIGTFQYMSPEQLEGKDADARSDLWALGCVLYEMATGKHAFQGSSQASLIAAILEKEPPPISALRGASPEALDRVVRACLVKDPDERIQTAHDVKLQLEWIDRDSSGTTATVGGLPLSKAPAHGRWRARAAWALALVATAALAFLMGRSGRSANRAGVVRFGAPSVAGTTIYLPGNVAVSPNGTMLAYVATDSAGERLWIRSLDALEPRALAGTEGAAFPFWSPDSRTLGFFAGGALKKVPAAGGSVQTLCDAGSGRGGSWGRGGVIVFAPSGDGPLYRVSANGGDPAPVLALDSARHETAQRWPCFLPDGDHFLYVSLPPSRGECETFVASLDGRERRPVLSSSQGAVFAAPHFVIFTRGSTVLGQRFDPDARRLSGEPVAVAELREVGPNLGEPCASASATGVMTYLDATARPIRLTWFDRAGQPRGDIHVPPAAYNVIWFSPDGRQLTVEKRNTPANQEIVVVDVARSTMTRLVSGAGFARDPIWSPDGQKVYYVTNRDGPYDIFARSFGGDGAEEPIYRSSALLKSPLDVSPDGKQLLFSQYDPATGNDIWLLPLAGDRKPVPWLRSPFNESQAAFSPDGRWVAYGSDESGSYQLHLRPFVGGGPKFQVSREGVGGFEWRADGKELFFWSRQRLMAAEVRTAKGGLEVGEPHALFQLPPRSRGWAHTPDGQRFVIGIPAGEATAPTPTIVLNWASALER